MSFPEHLREARKQAGFTQEALANKIGVTKTSIHNYERGMSFPLPYILYDLADVLDVDPREFLREAEDDENEEVE